MPAEGVTTDAAHVSSNVAVGSSEEPPDEPSQEQSGIDIDLDDGTMYSTKNGKKLSGAIQNVFSLRSSDLDRLKGIGPMLTVGDDGEVQASSDEVTVGTRLFGLAVIVAVLVAPGYCGVFALFA